ncbi:Unknown protein [Striga hermonthica]|uniref:Uncharacterized protein n=1 Tax=Striga hermonthica TaxID=68872 RepID=A0A9N7NGM8_STRHE|nr:Unknown protein [Striga hermonthica]
MEIGSSSQQKRSTTTDHMSIEIVNDDNLLSSIKQKLLCAPPSHSVYRVPKHLCKEHEESYYPALVSIGPFHRGRENLKATEGQNWQYFNTLLYREPNTEQILDGFVKALRNAEQKAREFYGEKITMSSDEFAEMLLLDGCFIIELFLEFYFKNLRRREDPFFTSQDFIRRLRCDLILFENQLPFFVLDQIFRLVHIPKHLRVPSLFVLASRFFKKIIQGDRAQFDNDEYAPHTHHLLDLIRQHYLPTIVEAEVLSSGGEAIVPQATQLSAIGIRVERAISESPANISLIKGKLEIPPLEINAYSEILFRNLVAMEYCDPHCTKHFTSYVVLMKGLVRSRRDARLLRGKEILVGVHEKEGMIVQFFQRLVNEDLNEKDFYYKGTCEGISEYQKRGDGGGVCWKNVRQVYHTSHLGIVGLSLVVLFLVVLFTGGLIVAVYFLSHQFQ